MLRCATRVKSLKNLGRVSVANVLDRLANSLSLSLQKQSVARYWNGLSRMYLKVDAKLSVSGSVCKRKSLYKFLSGIKVTQKNVQN